MKKYVFLLLLVGLTAACSKDSEGSIDPPVPVDRPVWERYTHAALLKLKGSVKTVRQYMEEDGEQYEQLVARFDAAGNCTYYNGTGIDPDFVTYGWGAEAVWFDYRYDAAGRMSSVVRYEVGAEPLTYTITYGSHEGYVIAPFRLGDIEPFMLKGVTRIEADGFLLTCDGKTVESEVVMTGWGASAVRTKWSLRDGMPAESESVTLRGDAEILHERITYSYEKNWLVKTVGVTTEPDLPSKTETVVYSAQWPCSPVMKTVDFSDLPEEQSVVQYDYAETGLITALRVTGSILDAEQPFEQWYNAYDAQNNWTSSTRRSEGVEQILSRTAEYYR